MDQSQLPPVNLQALIAAIQNSVIALNLIATNIKNAFVTVPLSSSVVYDPPNIVAGAQTTTTVTVAGAVVGGFAQVTFGLDLMGITLSGSVTAADTVTAVFFNGTVGAIDLGSGLLSARVFPA